MNFQEKTAMQYKLLASDYDNTLVPFGEHFPRPAVVKAVKKMHHKNTSRNVTSEQ